MRFRSFGVSASNMEEFIPRLKEKETEYLEESTLTQLNFTSLEEINSEDNDDYALLGPKSNYKIQKIRKLRKIRKRKRIFSNQFFRKKIYFYRHRKRSRLNSESINVITKMEI